MAKKDEEFGALASRAWLKRLKELADARLGLAVKTHRPNPIGPMVTGVKKVFRLASQPFINEILTKQATFNQELVAWASALTRDIEAVERSMVAMRAGLEIRLTRMEATMARLEKNFEGQTGTVVNTVTAGSRRREVP